MKNNVKEFRLGELFCGPGGLALGATTAKIENSDYKIIHKWANDYDRDTCNTYTRNICPDDGDSVICGDVRKLDIESLGDIDALAFGFPCNDFSVVGEQKGFDGKFGPLYSYGIKVLEKYHPQWFLAENVGGLKSANEGKAFLKIQEDMIAAGYGDNGFPTIYPAFPQQKLCRDAAIQKGYDLDKLIYIDPDFHQIGFPPEQFKMCLDLVNFCKVYTIPIQQF